jgi:NAD(P)-dependent dehydrogenase (short-subunit alcohol dehydrogenase family)
MEMEFEEQTESQTEPSEPLLISTGTLANDALAGQVAVVTGAGRGIGLEAARSLVWLGAHVIIAEVDKATGEAAAARINEEAGEVRADFIQADIGDEKGVKRLRDKALRIYEKVDIIVNNATVWPIGAVKDLPVDSFDASYRVNLRGPALLACYFLPDMMERDYGVFVGVYSLGGPFMAGYEVFKRGQKELADTLAAELEGTGVIVLTVDPGQVLTPGLEEAVGQLAPLYEKTFEEFLAMTGWTIESVEVAGAGFAAAVALASQFRGWKVTPVQALAAAGITTSEVVEEKKVEISLADQEVKQALELCRQARRTLSEQSTAWHKLPLFDRKWMLSNFRKVTGFTDEEWLDKLDGLAQALEDRDGAGLAAVEAPVENLAAYWEHLQELAGGFIEDKEALEKRQIIIAEWQKTAEKLAELINKAV